MRSVVEDKSKEFGYRIIDTYKYLVGTKNEYILSKQIVRSGTSVAANVAEVERAESKPDFYHKINIAVKEANETFLWLDFLRHGEYIDNEMFQSLSKDCEELIKILMAILRTRKRQPPTHNSQLITHNS